MLGGEILSRPGDKDILVIMKCFQVHYCLCFCLYLIVKVDAGTNVCNVR